MPIAAFHSCDVPANIYVNVTPGKEQVSFVTETFVLSHTKTNKGVGNDTQCFFSPPIIPSNNKKKNLFKLNVMYSF